MWPKVSVGRETVWEQAEQFGQDRAISAEAFGNIAGDFQAQGGDDGFQDLLNFVGGASSAISPEKTAALTGGVAGQVAVKTPNHEKDLLAEEVDRVDAARNELSEQLVSMSKTDSLVDKLVAKAQEVKNNSRLDRSVAELLTTQDALQDIAHTANKLCKFKKTKEGKDATAIDYKTAAAGIRDQISCLMADTKSVRAHLPKQAPANKK